MRARHLSFELEETAHGTFLLQGLLGGILAGFVYTAAVALWEPPLQLANVLFVFIFYSVFAGVLGILKSIIMWAPYRLAKIKVRAATRIAVSSIATGLFAFSLFVIFGSKGRNNFVAWMLTMLIGGLPTAILVGSSIKPWGLFTFGSIGGERRRSVVGTLGTLPLRFLSLLTLALYCLYFACKVVDDGCSVQSILVFLAIAFYLLFSAYVSFRSPGKIILLIAGLSANVSIALIGFAYVIQFNVHRVSEAPWYVSAICISLVAAWGVFLVARLAVRPTKQIPIEHTGHHCLGSRFVEWQQSF